MIAPRKFRESIEELFSCAPQEDMFYVVIPSTQPPSFGQEAVMRRFERRLCIPPERTLEYTPPGCVGVAREPRQEKIPQIEDPTKLYILVDDSFRSGSTLEYALKRLAEQNVQREKVWFLVAGIDDKDHKDQAGFLDKAETYLQYREKNPVEEV